MNLSAVGISGFGLILLSVAIGLPAYAGPAVTYHGRVLRPDGRAVESSSVTFKIQVRSPGVGNCLLYEETRVLDMRNSDGVFVIPIGDGSGARSAIDPGITIEDVFSNNPQLNHQSLSCNSGNHYQPQALDSRKLWVSFNDGGGADDQALPAMDINFVPFSLHAEEASSALSIGATPASHVMRVSSGTATPLSAANFAELLSLVNGTSMAYLKSSLLPSCGSGEVLKSSGGSFACVTDATGADTLAGISCADGKILKRVSGAWACADEAGIETESDPTVQAFAKNGPGSGLVVNGSSQIAPDFGTTAGKVTEGNDSRLSNSRAPNGAATGDLNGSYPNPTVKGIRGNAVSATPPVEGQVYKWVTGSNELQPKYVGVADLRKSDGTSQMPATCAASETLSWSSVSDAFTCASIDFLDASVLKVGTLPAARLPALTGDVSSIAGSNSISLNTVALTKGGTGLTAGGASNQVLGMNSGGDAAEYKSLTAGSGVTITHGVNSVVISASGSGGTVTSVTGTAPVQVAAGTSAPVISVGVATTSASGVVQLSTDGGSIAGTVVQATDSRLANARTPTGTSLASGQIWVGNSSNEAAAVAVSGDATLSSSGALALSTTGVSSGSYTKVTVDPKGRVTGSGVTTITDIKSTNAGTWFAASGACPAGQQLSYSAVSDALSCQNFSLTSSQINTALGYTAANGASYVSKAGDTMTGGLALPSNGLAVGASQFVVSGGNVGVGTASPAAPLHIFSNSASGGYGRVHIESGAAAQYAPCLTLFDGRTGASGHVWEIVNGAFSSALSIADTTAGQTRMVFDSTGNVGIGTLSPGAKLDVIGQSRSVSSSGGSQVNSSASIDWNNGNTQTMSVACTSTTMTNMLDGGTYILAVSETGATTCVFQQTGLTFYYAPANSGRTSGQRTVYSFQRIGSDVYVSWIKGFQ